MSMIFILIEIQFDIELNNNDELLIIIREHNKKRKIITGSVQQCGAHVWYLGEKNVATHKWHNFDFIIFHLFNDHILGCSPHCTGF